MSSLHRRAATAAALLAASSLAAATPDSTLVAQERPDSVRLELERLRARIDSLEALVRALQEAAGGQPAGEAEAQAGDALARLRAAAAAAAGGIQPADTAVEAEPEFVGRQRSLQALNPEISVTADVFAHMDVDDPDRDNFVPREFELSLQSALDPFSRAKIFLSVHNPGPELAPFAEADHGEEAGPEVGVEEGYVEWVGLPGGLNVKMGRFSQRFGNLNRWHAHALPFQSRSLPHLAFLGEEPLAQTGIGVSWLVPVAGAGTWETTLEITRSDQEPLFGASEGPSVLGNVNAFWQLSEATDLDLSLSWINGSYESDEALLDRNLYGIEGAFTWLPPARSKYRGVVVRAGAMLLDGLVPGAGEENALGLWSMTEVRVARQWLMGARLDWTEDPVDPDRTAWLLSPTLTWWQSEYVRIRAEYDVVGRSWLDEGEGRLWLQTTVAMGPHKHENY